MAEGELNGHILFIDAYDSFAENIIAKLRSISNAQITSIKIDSVLPCPIPQYLQRFDAVVAGPGPGNPGNSSDVGLIGEIWKLHDEDLLPVLGICLGFQSLCWTFGGQITRLSLPCHGQIQRILHEGIDLFEGVGVIGATNYHSLHVTLGSNTDLTFDSRLKQSRTTDIHDHDSAYGSRPSSEGRSSGAWIANQALQPLAFTEDNILMAVRHTTKPFWGLQFHPESCKSSPECDDLIRGWWQRSQKWNICSRRLVEENGHFRSNRAMAHPVSNRSEQILTDITHTHAHKDGLLACMLDLTQDYTLSMATMPIEYTPELALQILDFTEDHPQGMTACLESTKGGQYSIFSLPSPTTWRLDYWCSSRTARIVSATVKNACQNTRAFPNIDVLDCMQSLMCQRVVRAGKSSSPFWGGFLGYISYEMGLEKFKPSGENPDDDVNIPCDLSFLWVERCVVLDHKNETAWLQSIRRDDEQWLSGIGQELKRPYRIHGNEAREQALRYSLARSEMIMPDQKTYKERIRECQEALHAGDSYELCLTGETQIKLPRNVSPPQSQTSHALALYLRLRQCNPVPFASYLSLGNTQVVGASPEQFMTWSREGEINMIPMKGTVKKSSGMTYARACELLSSPKEQAENLMIADLIRHDLHSLFGTVNNVEVVKLCDVVEHETVYQLVSHIRTTIPSSIGPMNDPRMNVLKHGQKALISALPPGSMTGAPKKRSCEILSKLEKRNRGVYSGAIGYLDLGGAGAFSVCIRTAFCHSRPADSHENWRIGAGGAITVLSDEEAEWQEMRTKLDSVLRVFEVKI